MSPEPEARPASSRGYLTALVVAIAGTGIAVVWAAVAVVPVMSAVDEFPRADVPGDTTVAVEEAGGRIAYFERESWFATTPLHPDVEIAVTGPDGEPVPVSPYEGTVQYRLPGRVGQAHATFDAEEPGDYTVSVDGEAADDAAVAVGPGIAGTLAGGLVAPVVVLFVSFLVAVLIAVWTAGARSRDLR